MKIMRRLGFVEGLGQVMQSEGDFYALLQDLKGHLMTPREEAYARLATKDSTHIGQTKGIWTTAGFEYARGMMPILNLRSRLLNRTLAKRAIKANSAGRYFSTETTKEYEESAKEAEGSLDPVDRTVIVLPSRTQFTLSDKENWDIMQAILKDQAKPYFEFNGPIEVYPVLAGDVDSQGGTLLTQLWVGGLDIRRSYFIGDGRGFNLYHVARRLFKTSKGSA